MTCVVTVDGLATGWLAGGSLAAGGLLAAVDGAFEAPPAWLHAATIVARRAVPTNLGPDDKRGRI
jgi:hypothetical protein